MIYISSSTLWCLKGCWSIDTGRGGLHVSVGSPVGICRSHLTYSFSMIRLNILDGCSMYLTFINFYILMCFLSSSSSAFGVPILGRNVLEFYFFVHIQRTPCFGLVFSLFDMNIYAWAPWILLVIIKYRPRNQWIVCDWFNCCWSMCWNGLQHIYSHLISGLMKVIKFVLLAFYAGTCAFLNENLTGWSASSASLFRSIHVGWSFCVSLCFVYVALVFLLTST